MHTSKKKEKRRGETLFLNMHVLRSILEGFAFKDSTDTCAAVKTRSAPLTQTCFLSCRKNATTSSESLVMSNGEAGLCKKVKLSDY